ncbi:hypothetical protein PHMEG_00020143 [Phytophthora megakarya]|uniref:Uncharacterized protein n=1 Tax=Phytophthora megakarya TaxID=4795 RepID=A0A225VQ37_9STRA|nr:hypothetical protein PHMEG_00020143 [Phytophthora megakarya]
MNEVDDDLSAPTHLEFLATMLPRDFGVQAGQCRFLVNRLFATFLGVPLVGCASHRLNRAVQQDMTHHEDDLTAVQALIIKLRTLTQSAKLRFGQLFTRWSSTFAVVQRYLKLLEFLDAEDDDIMVVMPTPAATKRLRVLFKEQKDIVLLDASGPRASIIHIPDFGSGCVHVSRGRQDRLTRTEKVALLPFARVVEGDSTTSSGDENLSFVERIRKRRRAEEAKVTYEQLKRIPPMSNAVERFFSVARVTLGQQRHGLHSSTLETILF